MNAEPHKLDTPTPEERLVRDVVFNVAALHLSAWAARLRADRAVTAWQQYGSHGAPANHPHRALFHKVGHAQERRASLGDRVNQALEHENRPARAQTRRALIRELAMLAQQRARHARRRQGVSGL